MLKLPSAQQPQIVDIFTRVCTCSVIPRRRFALLPVLSPVPRLCVCALCYWLSSGNESGALILLKETIYISKIKLQTLAPKSPPKKVIHGRYIHPVIRSSSGSTPDTSPSDRFKTRILALAQKTLTITFTTLFCIIIIFVNRI